MKNLSRWAKAHPRQARLILILAHVCIAFGALTCGFLTYFADIALPPWLPILLANCFFIAYFFYPKKVLPKVGSNSHMCGKNPWILS